MDILLKILQDGIFAAIAAIGFAAISNPPRIAFPFCAFIAAMGHIARYCMLNFCGMNLIVSSFAGALIVGLLAVFIAPRVKCPPETFSFPALLPMIPGIYAYRTIQALVLALSTTVEEESSHYFYLCEFNGMTCLLVVVGMVVGQLIPLMIFHRLTYSSTKHLM